MPTRTIKATPVTYYRTAKPSTNFYTSAKSRLRVQSGLYAADLFFALPPEARGRNIDSAVVKLYATDSSWTATNSLQRHAKPATAYSRIVYNNRPATAGGSSAVTGVKTSGTAEWVWDVDPDVTAWSGGTPFYGFKLSTSDATLRAFYGPNTGATAPVLELAWSELPSAPANVSPAGGVTSTPKPVVQWLADDDVDLVQVQIDTPGSTWDQVAGFTSPTFDSGSVASAVGSVNLAATAYAGTANGSFVDMTARQHNALGWSPWSEPVNWGYAARPTIALTNPGAISGDPTPPHTWTASAQTAWQLIVTSGAKRYYDSGRVGGADLADTPDKGPTVDGTVVTSELRVIDRPDRVVTPGQPIYTSTSVTWTLDLDTAMTPASDFVVEQVGVTPQVRLSFMRAAGAPDEWMYGYDGETCGRFDFDENTAGAGWSLTSWECPPNQGVDFWVRPIINNVAGTARTAHIVTQVSGVWLADPDTDAAFSIGDETFDGAQASSSAAFTPIGGRRQIARTFGLRGTEGSVSGNVWDFDGETVAEQIVDFYAIRGLAATRELRQIYNRSNFAVAVLNMSEVVNNTEFLSFDQDSRVVRWDFYQSDYTADDPFEAD